MKDNDRADQFDQRAAEILEPFRHDMIVGDARNLAEGSLDVVIAQELRDWGGQLEQVKRTLNNSGDVVLESRATLQSMFDSLDGDPSANAMTLRATLRGILGFDFEGGRRDGNP